MFPKLESLDLEYMDLETIDLRGNLQLRTLRLPSWATKTILVADNNQITSFTGDVNHKTALNVIQTKLKKLEEINFTGYHSGLGDIDTSYWTNLRKFSMVSNGWDSDTMVNPLPVKGLKVTEKTPTTMTVKWNHTKSKYTGYVLYVYNDDTDKQVKRINVKKGTNKYKVKGLKSAGKYRVLVRAYRTIEKKKYYSASYKGYKVSYTSPKKPTLKAKRSGTKVKLSWKKQKFASTSADKGYTIYYKTSAKGKYKKLSGKKVNGYLDSSILKFTSSNKNVVTVSKYGNIKAIKKGTATIKVKLRSGKGTYSIKVRVTN